MTFLSELKVFVFARDVIMNQAINSFLMLSPNLQNHSVKVNVQYYSNIYKTSLQESAKPFSESESAVSSSTILVYR